MQRNHVGAALAATKINCEGAMKVTPLTLTFAQMPTALAKLVRCAAAVAKAQRRSLFLVGGFLRDWVLGRESMDLDFATSGDPISFADEVARQIGGRIVPMHDEPPMGRVVRWDENAPDATADFVELRGDIKTDLRQRDFTCNALAVDAIPLAQNGEVPILDPLGGLKHIAERTLVLTSKRTLRDDPVRILRAFRLSATLGFCIAPETMAAISQAAPLLLSAAPERLLMEFSWTLQAPNAHQQLLLMDETGVLAILLPETQKLKEVPAAGYHHLDGFHHTVEAVGMAEKAMVAETEDEMLNELLRRVQNVFGQRFGYRRYGAWVLKFATLLHDIGKPLTMSMDEDGDIHFYEHEKVGAEMAKQICQRLRLSRRESDLIITLVRNHMRPVSLAGARHLTGRALRRFWREMGEAAGIYCVALSAADLMATRGKEMTKEHRQRHYTVLRRLLETHFELKELEKRPRLITGDEVMARYQLPPSPLVGKALRLVEDAVMDGRIQTKDDAWALLDAAMAEWLASASSNGQGR